MAPLVPPFNATARIEVPDGVLVRELAGESVLLDLNSESYFGFDDVGTRMWSALTTSPTIEAAAIILIDEFEVAPERLRLDLHAFVTQLAEAGLVTVVDA